MEFMVFYQIIQKNTGGSREGGREKRRGEVLRLQSLTYFNLKKKT